MITITLKIANEEENPLVMNPRQEFDVKIHQFDHIGAMTIATKICQMIEEGFAPVDNARSCIQFRVNPVVFWTFDFWDDVWQIVEETPLDV